jgi:hypothetical protein
MIRTIRKLTQVDRFAKRFYCQHAKLAQTRQEKKAYKKLLRQIAKEEIREEQQ